MKRLIRGVQYAEDVKQLRKLKLEDVKLYGAEFRRIMKEYDISQRQLYRDMKSRIPGLRKIRSDTGKLKSRMTSKQKRIVSEAMESGMLKKDALKLAEETTKKRISYRVSSRTKSKPIKDNSRTNFADNIRPFLEKLCGYNLMSPRSVIKLKLGKLSFSVKKEDLQEIILILTNAFNRSNENNSLPLDKNELFRKKIFQLLEYNIKLAEESCDLKSLESITRMYNSIQEEHDLGADFEIVYKICSELKPGISRPEVISLIKQSS